MTDEIEISALPEMTDDLADDDLLVMVDTSATVTKKLQISNFVGTGEKQVFLPMYKYIDPANSSSVHYKPWNTTAYMGVMCNAGVLTGSIGMTGVVPMDYKSGGKIIPVVNTFLSGTSGEYARFYYEVNIGDIGGRIDSRTSTLDYEYEGDVEIYRLSPYYWFVDMPELVCPTIYPGDILSVSFQRQGNHANDTYTGILCVRGAIFSYS